MKHFIFPRDESVHMIYLLITMQVDVISSVPVEMMYSEEDMDKAGFMRLNKVILAISFP